MSVDNQDQLSFSGGGLNGIQDQANGSGSDQSNAGLAQAAHARIAQGIPAGGGQGAAPSPSASSSGPARWFGNALAAVLGKLLSRSS